MTLEEAARLLDYEEALQRPDLSDEQRQALRTEIARLSSAAPAPIELPPPPPASMPTPAALDLQAELEAQARGRAAAEERPYTTPAEFRRLQEQETERAREDIAEERAVTVQPGVPGTVAVEDAGIFRPTRIRYVPQSRTMEEASSLLDLEEALQRPDLSDEQRKAIQNRIDDLQPRLEPFYRDPETGAFRPATALEELTEARSQQILATEQEARRQAGRGEAPIGILSQQREGVGITETGLQQALRTVLGSLEATIGEAWIRGLGFEVDEEGNPKDPEDFAYQARLMLDKLEEQTGLQPIPEAVSLVELLESPIITPLKIADAAVLAAYSAAGIDLPTTFTDLYNQNRRETAAGLAVIPGLFAPSESTTQQETFLDPEGRMVVSDIEVPPFWENPAGFVEAETRRLARSIAAGRSLMDETRSSPASQAFARDVYGHEDWAYAPGVPLMLATPATPLGVIKPVATGAAAAGRLASRAGTSGFRNAADALRTIQMVSKEVVPSLHPAYVRTVADPLERVGSSALFRAANELNQRAFDPGLYADVGRFLSRETSRRLDSPAFASLNDALSKGAERFSRSTPGAVVRAGQELAGHAYTRAADIGAATRRAYTVLKGGQDSDALVNSRMTEAVLRYAGLEEDAVQAIMDSLDFAKLRTSKMFHVEHPEAWSKIAQAIRQTGRVSADQQQQIERLLKLNLPEDYVMVTDTLAVPRHHAAEIRTRIGETLRSLTGSSSSSAAQTLERLQSQASNPAALAPLIRRLRAAGTSRTADVVSVRQVEKAVKQAGLPPRAAGEVLSAGQDTLLELFGFTRADAERIGTGRLGLLDVEDGRVLPLTEQSSRAAIMEQMAAQALDEGVNTTVRRARDIGAGQRFLNNRQASVSNLIRGTWDTPLSRSLRIAVQDPTVSTLSAQAVRLQDTIRRAGRLAESRVARELSAAARAYTGPDSINRALDQMLSAGLEEFGLLPEEAWSKVFPLLYGEAVSPDEIATILRAQNLDNVTSKYPTISSMMAVDSVLSRSPIENITAPHTFNTPDFQKISLSVYLDEVFARVIAGETLAEGMDIGLWQQASNVLGLNIPTTRSLVLNPEIRTALDYVLSSGDRTILNIPGPHGLRTPSLGLDRLVEDELAAAPWEFVQYTGKVPPRGRQALAELAAQGAAFLGGHARLSIQQGMKYGYFLPNLRTAVFKGLTVPFVMASQLGVSKALQVAPRAVSGALRGLLSQLSQRAAGLSPGLNTARYGYLTGAELVSAAERRGVGFTAISAERVYSLAEDILHSVRRTLPEKQQGNLRWTALSPLQKTFWMRTAEAMDRSFRQGVFEARLLAGDTLEEAAEAGRKALFDYDEVPKLIAEKLGGVFQGAGSLYKLTTELTLAGMRNPQSVTSYLKALELNRKRQDPYNIGGDSSLLNFRMDTSNGSYLLRVPGADLIDAGMNSLIYGDTAVKNLSAVLQAWEKARPEETVNALTSVVWDGATPLAYSVLSAGLSQSVAAYMEFEAVEPMTRGAEDIQQMSTEKLMWAALINARHIDPTGEDGVWDFVWTNLDPVVLEPPPELQVEGTRYWSRVPTLQPHIYMGEINNQAAYMVVEPSPRGETLLQAIQQASSESLQAYYTAGVGLYYGDTALGTSGGAVPQKFFAQGAVPTTPLDIALSLIANPTYVDYSKPESERAEQAQRYLQAREMVQ